MDQETAKPEWQFAVPKPSKRAVLTAVAGAVAVALGTLFYTKADKPRVVIWQGGERQTDWKPTVQDFRSATYNIGITEDGFMVARPIRVVPAPAPIVPPPEKAVTPLTNK